jgi:putative membrane-bound dehydrogenase-like protein
MNRRGIGRLGFVLVLAVGRLAVNDAGSGEPKLSAPSSPVSPEDSLKFFQLDPACRIELAAAEPQVIDPVAVRFGEDGRMWVVEMRDYPHGPPKGQPGTSQIKVLEDRDGDGRYEHATVFADKLLFPTGLQPWKGGMFVTLAGRVAYLKDADGDGRADIDETWFTGFAQENSQLRANHPRFALDNHIYVANGLRNGKVVNVRRSGAPSYAKPIDISGMDFRFNPLTGDCETVSGHSQFGLTFDDYGNRFFCTNRNPLVHVVLEQRYLKRNPAAAVPSVVQDVAAAGEQSRVFPISRAWTTSNLHAGQFTAACGVEIYRGDALTRAFYGDAFTCDPTGNLVHREVLGPLGATFKSEPAYKDREFLASTDEWFRPVNLTVGPDGGLYVVDMYRAVIEHPDFVPDELKKRPDLMLGSDRGRIWRIVSKSHVHSPRPHLSRAKSEALVEALQHSNVWQRETAHRLLVERQDKAAAPTLEAAVRDMKRGMPARIQALWTLEGLASLSPELLLEILKDEIEWVRVAEQALLLCERRFDDPTLRAGSLLAVPRGDARWRFQKLLTMMFHPSERVITVTPRQLWDKWFRQAYVIASGKFAPEVLSQELLHLPLIKKGRRPAESQAALDNVLPLLVELAKQVKPDKLPMVLESAVAIEATEDLRRAQFAVLQALARSLPRHKTTFIREIGKLKGLAAARLQAVLNEAAQIASDGSQSAELRLAAIDLLAHDPNSVAALAALTQNEPSQPLRVRAIAALSLHGDDDSWKKLLSEFRQNAPAVRHAVIEAVLSRSDRASLLLDEIEAARIKPGELDQAHVNRLIKHGNAALRDRATKLLADAIPADRQKVLTEYQTVLRMPADAKRGLEVFKKNCAACHRVGEVGVNVAPDISDSRVKTAAQLLTDILQPNRAIDANYVSYTLLTTDGRSLVGVVASETATAVTLRQQEGKTVTLLRSEIERMQSNGVSLMPEGLEKTIDHQQMADVISYVKNWRYLDGRTPLGK